MYRLVQEKKPSRFSEPYQLLLRTSLTLALVGGFGLGLYLLLSFALRLPLPGIVGTLIQVHGQVQALGFVALFIMAVASRLVPRLHGARLVAGSAVSLGGLMLAAGVVLRAVAQPITPSLPRDGVVVLSGVLILGGVVLAMSAFVRTIRGGSRRQESEPVVLPLTMGGSLLAALVLNLVASIGLALGGNTVPVALDEAILHLELWGFASTMVLAIARHAWPNLLLLRPARQALTRPSLILWAVGSFGVPLSWLIPAEAPILRALATCAQLAGAVLYAYGLRLFEPPARASSMPRVTNAARSWARTAFCFLFLSAMVGVVTAIGGLVGSPSTFTSLSAARHALAQGFLLPVIVFMAARILPGYSGLMVGKPRVLAGIMWTLFASALLRAGGELVGGYGDGWNAVVACGGTLGAGAFVVFAFGLWRATPRTVHHPRMLPVLS